MKKLKSIFAILITISLLFSLAACSKGAVYIDESSVDENQSDYITDSNFDESQSDHITSGHNFGNPEYPPVEERDYSIEYIDGKYYYVFEQPERYIGSEYYVTWAEREDWREFRYDLLYGELSIGEKKIIANESSRYGGNMECPDFYNFYGPVVPEDLTVAERMSISGGKYAFDVRINKDKYSFMFLVLTKDAHDRRYEIRHNKLHANETMTSYTLQDENKTIEVDKIYQKGVFYKVDIYGTQHGRYFSAEILAYEIGGKEPTDEWLLSFGLELYASENE